MTKNYILFLTTILVGSVASAQSLSSSPTLTFTNNSGISTDNIASDGDGGSINISDIDIQIYNISDVNGTILKQLSWENNGFLASSNSSFSGITRNDLSQSLGSKGMLIKSVDGKEFKLNQFVYYNWGETVPLTNTIKGYKDNIQVASTSFQGYDGGNNIPMTIILDASFQNVDEVRFYISSGGYLGDQSSTNHTINSIKFSSPVTTNLGLNDFESKRAISVYSNLKSNIVTIELGSNANSNLSVYDSTGKLIFGQNLVDFSNEVSIEKLTSGIYFFKINSSGIISTTKIIKR